MKKIISFICLITVFLLTSKTIAITDSSYIDLDFWQKFNDEILLENISQTYSNNHDLKSAAFKVEQAQRIVKMSFADELPHLGFQGYAGQIFNSSDELFGDVKIPDYTESHFLLPLTMNYEIDIWGKNYLKTKSKKMQYEMIKQDERSAYIYVISALACDYYNLVRADKLIEYQKHLINLQKEIISSYQKRYDFGLATLSEIENAQKNLTFLEEDLSKMLEKQDILKNQISVILSDRSFDEVKRIDFDNLKVSLKTPDSIDFNVLDKRPDKIKSELNLEKAGIDIKIARRDMLPKFIITGNIGFNMYNLHSTHKFLADLGVVPAWDLFLGGKKIQMLKLKKNSYNIAIENYEKTILKAIQETQDALYCLKTANNINQNVIERLNSDNKELNYTIARIDAGTKDKIDLLIQEEKVISSKKQLVTSEINKIISSINLYQALGGVDFN